MSIAIPEYDPFIRLNANARSAYDYLRIQLCKIDYFFTRFRPRDENTVNTFIDKQSIERNVGYIDAFIQHIERMQPIPNESFFCLMHIIRIMTKRRLEEWAHLVGNRNINTQTYVQPFTDEDAQQLIIFQDRYHQNHRHYATVLKRDYLAIRFHNVEQSSKFTSWIVPDIDILARLNIATEEQIFYDIEYYSQILRELYPQSLEAEQAPIQRRVRPRIRGDMPHETDGLWVPIRDDDMPRENDRLRRDSIMPPENDPFWQPVHRIPRNQRMPLEARRSDSIQEVWDCPFCADPHSPQHARIKCETCDKSSCLEAMERWDLDLFNAGKNLICPYCRGVHPRKVEPRFRST